MGIYAQAGGVLLLFAFIFLIFFAGRGWRWHHVTALVLVFLSTFFFVFLAAAVLKNHSTWRTRYQQMAAQLEQELQKTDELKYGPLAATEEPAPSLRHLQNELERIIVDRGRVWRDVQLTGAQGPQITFRFPDRNVTGVETPPPLHRLQQNAIIYGFKEIENPEGWKVPALYMGEYVVTAATPDSVTVTPNQPLDQFQSPQVRPDGMTWAFYEVMPNDAHYKFEALAKDPETRATMIRELLMPGGWHGRPAMAPQPLYENAVRQYVRDGQEPAPDDPPERVWVVVELTQPWKQKVDADDPATQLPTQNFNVSGLAVTPHLRMEGLRKLPPGTDTEGHSEFEAGDQIELDNEAADRLIKQGIARRVKTVYRRPLRDYAYNFVESNRRLRVLAERTRLTTEDVTTVQQAIDKAKGQIAFREDEKTKLQSDLANVGKERDAMTQYVSTLQTQFNGVLGNLRAVYTENLELVKELRQIEQAIIDAVQQQLANVNP